MVGIVLKEVLGHRELGVELLVVHPQEQQLQVVVALAKIPMLLELHVGLTVDLHVNWHTQHVPLHQRISSTSLIFGRSLPSWR